MYEYNALSTTYICKVEQTTYSQWMKSTCAADTRNKRRPMIKCSDKIAVILRCALCAQFRILIIGHLRHRQLQNGAAIYISCCATMLVRNDET